MREHNYQRIEPTTEAEDQWTAHVAETFKATLLPLADSWFIGANTPGKRRNFLMYAGGTPAYRAKCDAVAANDYEGFRLR
jgi:cyclohexanone monooxygenase